MPTKYLRIDDLAVAAPEDELGDLGTGQPTLVLHPPRSALRVGTWRSSTTTRSPHIVRSESLAFVSVTVENCALLPVEKCAVLLLGEPSCRVRLRRFGCWGGCRCLGCGAGSWRLSR